MKRIFLTLLLLFSLLPLAAQELKFKSFECRTTDIKAKVNQRNDINGNPCALIRVCMAAKNPTIRGNMGNVGEVTSPNPSEYEVYVPAGTRRIRISHPDYLPFTYEFSMKIEGLMTYELYIIVPEAGPTKPEIKTQYLALQVTPSDAMVLIDGMPQQVENGSLVAKFELGSHSYHIMAPQYHAIEGVFELNSEKRTDLKLDLKPRFGYLDIKSTPEGASVLVDGEVRGKTPCRIKLGSGEHFLQLMSDGYIAYGQNLTMSDGATIPLTMALKANFAQITLKAPYEHSEIWVNDKLLGKGSWTGRLNANTYLVETRTEGYENASENIEVLAEVSRTYTLQSPKPIYALLEVLSTPFDATIKLDGKVVGTTPWQSNEVLVGNHTLEISKEGYETHSESFTLTRDIPKSVNLTLKKSTPATSGTTIASESAATKTYKVGDYYDENGKKGVVFWVDGTGQHGKIVHMYEDYVSLTWFNYNSSFLVELGTDRDDGEKNMALVKSNNMKSRYSAFTWCEKSGAGWYLPAIGELEDLALDGSVLNAVNNTLKQKGGETLTARKYVSSSESGKFSFWYLQMAGSSKRAYQGSKSVKSDYVVRPVAKF